MIISTSLVGTPFVSSTDSTRLQMSSKQLSQTLTHFNCKRPYVIGKEWSYLTSTTRLFRLQAPYDGSILYSNNEIMIILYDESQELKVVSIPEYFHTFVWANLQLSDWEQSVNRTYNTLINNK